VTVEFTAEEVQELGATLEEIISDLRMEIADTDSADFRESLHRRKDLLTGLYRKVTGHDLT
jgi:hypothetical protein